MRGTPTALSSAGSLEVYPAVSPDGATLAYASNRTGLFEIYVRRLDGGPERAVTADGGQNFQPAWSPDGKRLVFHSRARGGLWIVDLAGGAPFPLTNFGTDPAWSPDGSTIAFQSHALTDLGATAPAAIPPSTIWVVPARGGPARDVTREGEPPGGHGQPLFTPDGRSLLFAAADPTLSWGEVWRVPLAGGAPERLLRQPRVYDPALSADGVWLFFSGGPPAFPIFRARLDVRDAVPEKLLSLPELVSRHPCPSRDGKRLVFAGLATPSNLWSLPLTPEGLPAGEARPLMDEPSRNTFPIFSPDGRRILFGRSFPGLNPDVWVVDRDGRGARALTRDESSEYPADWFPDGRHVLYLSDRQRTSTVFRVDVETGREETVKMPGSEVGLPRLSPDGRWIAYHTKHGGITLNTWRANLETGATQQLTFDREMLAFPCFSADGRTLAVEVKRGDDVQVVVLPFEGGTPVQLTSERGLSWPHSFSPDGDRVAFSGLRDGVWNLYWVSRGTRVQQALTRYTGPEQFVRYPSWAPDGKEIVFEKGVSRGRIYVADLE